MRSNRRVKSVETISIVILITLKICNGRVSGWTMCVMRSRSLNFTTLIRTSSQPERWTISRAIAKNSTVSRSLYTHCLFTSYRHISGFILAEENFCFYQSTKFLLGGIVYAEQAIPLISPYFTHFSCSMVSLSDSDVCRLSVCLSNSCPLFKPRLAGSINYSLHFKRSLLCANNKKVYCRLEAAQCAML